MPVFVKTVGILVCCITAIAIFSPSTMRQIAQVICQGKRLYGAAAFRVVMGALLMWAAFSCSVTWVVFTVGLVTLLAGGFAIAMGLPKMQAFVAWWTAKSDGVLRAMAVVGFLFGAALVYSA